MPANLPQWQSLSKLAADPQLPALAALVQAPAPRLLCSAASITADFRKQRITETVLNTLLELARACELESARAALFGGAALNNTENRAVLHTAARASAADLERRLGAASDVGAAVVDGRSAVAEFTEAVRGGHWRGLDGRAIDTVINIGIGGSHLGPELAFTALAGACSDALDVQFLSNIDGDNAQRLLAQANPATTLFVIASKSFGTQETAVNAAAARSWFLERTGSLQGIEKHFVAVTNNLEAAAQFGIPAANLFGMGDWIGGRYSLWSAVGLAVALGIGWPRFAALLDGAAAMDTHFLEAPLEHNMPVLLALAGIWNTNFLGCDSHAVLPYDDRLRLLPDYLQQLEMESNGKRTRTDGTPVTTSTGPMLWGGRGTNGQHAFHQLLHQGTRQFSADFILCRAPDHDRDEHHRLLAANAMAQSQAMAIGRSHQDPHRAVPGNRPNTTLLLESLTPHALGALLALYEHKVFCQGIIWHINSFDQWGVELGKDLAKPIHAALAQGETQQGSAATGAANAADQDAATKGLIDLFLGR
ncbi:MAG: glucose-6-phosphate isomerase [Pseudomonadales bacterium]